VAPYSEVDGCQRFGGTYRLHLHGENTKLYVLSKRLAAICQLTLRQMLEDQNTYMNFIARGFFLDAELSTAERTASLVGMQQMMSSALWRVVPR
jgi:hypothetical protein